MIVTTTEVSEIHPVVVLVKINLAVPAETPVIKPALLMVATAISVLCHVPPVVGEILVVLPTQILLGPFKTVIGFGATVITPEFAEVQPSVDVNLNVAIPSATPVTTPVKLLMVAINGLLEDHVPVAEAVRVVVVPIQMLAGPIVIVGLGITATLMIGSEKQPAVDWNVNIAVPCAIPVIIPAFVMVAAAALLEAHVPPVVGVTVDVLSIQMLPGPVKATVGLGLTVTVIGVD